jgi:hypothetical protein
MLNTLRALSTHNKLACFCFVWLDHRLLQPLHVFASLVVCSICGDIMTNFSCCTVARIGKQIVGSTRGKRQVIEFQSPWKAPRPWHNIGLIGSLLLLFNFCTIDRYPEDSGGLAITFISLLANWLSPWRITSETWSNDTELWTGLTWHKHRGMQFLSK